MRIEQTSTMVRAGQVLVAMAAVCLAVGTGCTSSGAGGADANYDDPIFDSGPTPWFRDAASCGSGSSGTSGTCCGSSGTSGTGCASADAGHPDATPCDFHTFYYVGEAEAVYVSGDFTSWALPGEGALEMTPSGNTWSVGAQIGPGRHLYKLIVDGIWMADPSASEQEPDGFGDFNSVIEVCTDVDVN